VRESTGLPLLSLPLFLLDLLFLGVGSVYEMIMKSGFYRCHGLGWRGLLGGVGDKVCLARGRWGV